MAVNLVTWLSVTKSNATNKLPGLENLIIVACDFTLMSWNLYMYLALLIFQNDGCIQSPDHPTTNLTPPVDSQ